MKAKYNTQIIDRAEPTGVAPTDAEFIGYYTDSSSELGHAAVYRASSDELYKVAEEVTI